MLIVVSVFTEVCVDDPAPESEPPTPSPTTEFSATDAPIINVTVTNSLIAKLSPKSRTNGSSASQSSRSSTTQSEISSSDMSFQVREGLFMRPILGLEKKATGLLWTEGVAYNTNSQTPIMHSWDPFPGASTPYSTPDDLASGDLIGLTLVSTKTSGGNDPTALYTAWLIWWHTWLLVGQQPPPKGQCPLGFKNLGLSAFWFLGTVTFFSSS